MQTENANSSIKDEVKGKVIQMNLKIRNYINMSYLVFVVFKKNELYCLP